jgi:hypothetical protein
MLVPRQMVAILALMVVVQLPGCETAIAAGDRCDSVFLNTSNARPHPAAQLSSEVYVKFYDSGAGIVRVVRGRVDVADYTADGSLERVEVFHDRGRGVYFQQDVFYPIESHWVKVHGRTSYEVIELLAKTLDGKRFVGRGQLGALEAFQIDQIFSRDSSER